MASKVTVTFASSSWSDLFGEENVEIRSVNSIVVFWAFFICWSILQYKIITLINNNVYLLYASMEYTNTYI